MDPTIILPKPTTDPDEFEVRASDLIDGIMASGRRYNDLPVAVARYQAQCFALFLREDAQPVHAAAPTDVSRK